MDRRFQIVSLEDRIAPSATVLDPDLPDGYDLHVVVTPSGNVNGDASADTGLVSDDTDFHIHPNQK